MSVMCRTRDDYRIEKPSHYVNYCVELVDGKPVRKPCDVVIPSLASEHSIEMNALRNNEVSHRSRKNIDAVDLPDFLDKLTTK